MLTCISPGGSNVSYLNAPPKMILVGSSGGIFSLKREGTLKSWTISGHSLAECHVHAVLLEESSGLLFAGIHNGTVYVSRDLGKSWEPRDKGITQNNIYTLSYVRVNGNIRLFAGTEPAHLFFSDDLGMTWKEISSLRTVPSVPRWTYPQPPYIAHVKQIAFDPNDPKTIYVCVEQGGLLRSLDAGLSWEELKGFYEDVHRLSIVRSDPRKMYLACGDGLYYSADGGSNWEHLTTRSSRIGYPDGLVVHPKREELIFISGAATIPPTWSKTQTANSCVGRSGDGGRSWEFLNNGFPQNFRGNIEALAMAIWNSSYSLFAGTTDGDIFFSDDEGYHWTPIAAGLPPIAKRRHHLYFHRASSVA